MKGPGSRCAGTNAFKATLHNSDLATIRIPEELEQQSNAAQKKETNQDRAQNPVAGSSHGRIGWDYRRTGIRAAAAQ